MSDKFVKRLKIIVINEILEQCLQSLAVSYISDIFFMQATN